MACMKLLRKPRMKHYSIVFLVAFAFLISSLQPSHFMAQGREFPNGHANGKLQKKEEEEEEEMGVEMRFLIGSRPPRCDERCRNCGHCEAVQVPIAPGLKLLNQERVEYSRGDDISSYKPMCWKCKCGDFFFNP